MYVTANMGDTFRRLRMKYGYSVTKAAERVNITPAELMNIEEGGRNVKGKLLSALCELYCLCGWRRDILVTGRGTLNNGKTITLRRGKIYVDGVRVRHVVDTEDKNV